MVIFDTNIIIDYLRQKEKSPMESMFEKRGEQFGISVITIQELFAGKSTRNIKEEEFLLSILVSFKVFPYTYAVAKRAGEIERDAKQPIEFPDAAIAATAIINDSQLYTLNTKDFLHIPELQLYKP